MLWMIQGHTDAPDIIERKMLSGVKYVPRDQIKPIKNDSSDDIQVRKGKTSKRSGKTGRRSKIDDFTSSEDEYVHKLNATLKQKKKWYSSDPSSAPSSEDENRSRIEESNDDEMIQRKRNKRKKRGQKKKSKISSRKVEERSNKSKSKREHSSEASLSNFENTDSSNDEETMQEKHHPKEREHKMQVNIHPSTGEKVRMEMGMHWMLGPMHRQEAGESAKQVDPEEEPKVLEAQEKQTNPKELNPYLKNNGSGYPEETSCAAPDQEQPVSLPIVGDGGASWRLKALKRAKEQASREGRKLDEVVEERWGSLGQMTLSAVRNRPAPSHAHLHAIQDRKRGNTGNIVESTDSDQVKGRGEWLQTGKRDYLKGISVRNPDMKEPKAHGSLSWRRRKDMNKSELEVELISSAAHGLNKYVNDGTFLQSFSHPKDKGVEDIATDFPPNANENEVPTTDQTTSANHLAAKVLQLRMKGKHEEAGKLLKESEKLEDAMKMDRKNYSLSYPSRSGLTGGGVRKKEDDADMHLAMKIMQNKQYKASDSADEYDYDLVVKPKKKQKAMSDHVSTKHQNVQKRIMTQQERCQFCFENPNRPKHLVVSIGNLSYLMLPPWKPVVDGHCCILPMQHEASTRNLDDDAWDELRNFKKCLLRMFAQEEKEVIFLETAITLSQQRRHCLVECIPLPHAVAKEAPLYFKKAIDEAEDEWSQHNAKKLIDTSLKGGLRNSIPKNFPYFHVEFGLHRGFVHVIDDEKNFKSSMGLDVIRGMMQLPEEDMHRRRQYSSMETQKNDVSRFSRAWAPFDWTRALD